MLFDALTVFLEVCVFLAIILAILWAIAKLAGYVAMVIEGEPLVDGVRHDVQMTRRQVKRLLHPGASRRPHPTA